jgi:hypothetical protein
MVYPIIEGVENSVGFSSTVELTVAHKDALALDIGLVTENEWATLCMSFFICS